MTKNFILFIFFCFSILFFSGCANLTFEISTNSNGEISQIVTIYPDYDLLENNGYSKDTVNERIITIFKDVLHSQENQLNTDISMIFAPVQKNKLLERVKSSHTINDNNIVLSLNFKNYSDYMMYYGITDDGKSNTKITTTPLYVYSETTTKTIFSSLKESNITKYAKKMFSYQNTCPFDCDDINYTYKYTTYDSRQKSDADNITSKDDLYTHKWEIGKNLDRDIHFYKFTKIIAVNWYYLSLFITLCVFVILMIINEFIRNKKQNTKE